MRNLTEKEVGDLGKQLDSVVMSARAMEGEDGMYARLNRLEKESGVKWRTLRGPVWVGDLIVMVMLRPRDDDAPYNKRETPWHGECTNGWELPDENGEVTT